MFPSIQQIGDLLFTVLKNIFWWFFEQFLKVLIALIDFIASILPGYDIDLPSVVFSNFPILQWLDWVFPVQHLISCVSVIVTNLAISFVIVPLLRWVKVSK